jgi:hypothetical protein
MKNVQDHKIEQHQKTMIGFWVEKALGIQIKEEAWRQQKTLSQFLRELCRRALSKKPTSRNQTDHFEPSEGSSDSPETSAHRKGGKELIKMTNRKNQPL